MEKMRDMINSLPEEMNPINYGGVVAKQYRSQDQMKNDTTFEYPCFRSCHSLPDIQPRTKIVAVCGGNDWNDERDPWLEGRASPQQSGWFFSDFYLMHHLFKNVADDQEWLTCVDPLRLCEKYGHYIHGNPPQVDSETKQLLTEDTRRVVLDKLMVENGEVADVKVIHPDNLAGVFSTVITRAVKQAEEQDRPVLIMIFSHGTRKFKFQLGGSKADKLNPRFGEKEFKLALGQGKSTSKRRLCLLTTACYSGGWAINPSYDCHFSSLTAAPDWDVSNSWPASATVNQRCTGSPWVSALAEVFAKLAIEDLGSEADLPDDLLQGVTYAAFTKVLTETMRGLHTAQFRGTQIHNPMFSSRGDEWEESVTDRTGIPLQALRGRWLKLKAAAGYQPPPTNRDGDRSMCPVAFGERSFTYDMLVVQVLQMSDEYMDSYPGPDTQAPNTLLHNSIAILRTGNIVNGKQRSIRQLLEVHHTINYRMNSIMRAATVYKDHLGIRNMPPCTETDLSPWWRNQNWRNIANLVRQYDLFDKPNEMEGRPFEKGYEYITACILQAGWNSKQAEEELDSLVAYRTKSGTPVRGVSKVINTSPVMYELDRFDVFRKESLRKTIRGVAFSISKKWRNVSPAR